MPDRRAQHLAVVATTPDDSHIWNLVGVQLKLEERGFQVCNLGACTPAELVAEVVRNLQPELLVISSINGHGAISMSAVIRALEEYQVKRSTTIIAGGLLTTDPTRSGIAAAELVELGCSGVFSGDDAWIRFDRFIKRLRATNVTGLSTLRKTSVAVRNQTARREPYGMTHSAVGRQHKLGAQLTSASSQRLQEAEGNGNAAV